ncbi:uncharacterized protein AMSG_11994 [Thecamonas trahens ATCC 50062]|uniref:DUF7630 domain-containing protein n=1 Tax=Thecamonas trahens ATCC 50062 TaxID=461836 RepID=A0A0L0DFZ6_THETB|nr:hypothetical protein AMSG_11994 [Thecamonas trahens ATCC 50062]KNC51234.1 hypothetical protein AMSG_11994 [Thecamonas trahens ATCC 50062]|eukprot:XP_013756445.1 hypothetical protein AMSG_11994 [Thecamonas trahens ATCC 50062]
MLLRLGDGFICIYDITSRLSFDEIDLFREHIMRMKDVDSFPMVLVGNKADLDSQRTVEASKGTQAAASLVCNFYETSAKTGANIDRREEEKAQEAKPHGQNHLDGRVTAHAVCELALAHAEANDIDAGLNVLALPLDSGPHAVAVGDVTGDGLLDLAFSLFESNHVGVAVASPGDLLGMASGAYIVIADAYLAPAELKLGFIDEDNVLDIVVPWVVSDIVTWYSGSANLSAVVNAHRIVAPVVDHPRHIALGDVDLDGDVDVLISSLSEDLISFRRNDGSGSFAERIAIIDDINGPRSLALADINGDNLPDIVAADSTGNHVVVVLAAAPGLFIAGKQEIMDNVDAIGLTLADFDGDGQLDIVTADTTSSAVHLLTFPAPALTRVFPKYRTVTVTANGAAWATIADFTGDGWKDVVVASPNDNSLVLHPNDGRGFFIDEPETLISGVFLGARAVDHADFDADGAIDLVAAGDDAATVGLWRNAGRGSFATAPFVVDADCAGAMKVKVADLNGDNAPDIVAACADSVAPTSAVKVYTNPGPAVAFSATWPALAIHDTAPTDVVTVDIAIGDIDGDGRPDIAVSYSTIRLFGWLRNLDAPSAPLAFAPLAAIHSPTAGFPRSLALCDADADGALDIILGTNGGSPVVSVAYGSLTSPGSFSAPIAVPGVFADPYLGPCVDVNGDGSPDLALGSAGDDRIVFVANAGGRDWEEAQTVTSLFDRPANVALGDINNDGFLDLTATIPAENSVRLFVQRPALRAKPALPLLPSHPTVFDLHYALSTASRCMPVEIELPPGATLGHCPTAGHLLVPADAWWSISGPASATRPVIDCAIGGGGVLWEVVAGGQLTLANLVLANATVGASPTAVTGLRAAGAGADLRMANVTITSFSSISASPFQFFAGMGGALAVVDGAVVEAIGCEFVANSASDVGGGIVALGQAPSLTLVNTVLRGNKAGGRGGGGLAVVANSATITITGGCITANIAAAGSGGGIMLDAASSHSTVSISRTGISANSARLAGGGVAAFAATGAQLSLGDAAFISGNDAAYGGAVASMAAGYVMLDAAASSAAWLSPVSSPVAALARPTLVIGSGSTLAHNTASYGGSMFACGAEISAASASMSGPSSARIGGGLWFVCSGSASLPTWIQPPANAGSATLTADGYGPVGATPATALTINLPSSAAVITGVAVGSGWVGATDALGQAVVDGSLVASISVAAPFAVRGAELGIQFAIRAGGGAALDSVVVSGPGSALPAELELAITLEGPGSQARETVAIVLGLCPPGYGASGLSSTESELLRCVPCSDGSYSPSSSAEPCNAIPICPGRAFRRAAANATALVSCECELGAWTREAPPMLTAACEPCPRGAVCDGGWTKPRAGRGFFPIDGSEELFLSCPNAAACVGGGRCAAGYQSTMCSACAHGYYRLGTACRPCDSTRQGVIITLLVLAGVALVALLLVFNLSEQLNYRFAAAMIGLNALQVAALYGKIEIEWGDFGDLFFDIASSVNLNIELSSPECAASAGVDVWVVKLILTLLLPVMAAIVVVIVVCTTFYPLQMAGAPWFCHKTSAQLISASVRTMFQILVLLYLPLVAAAFSVFGCARDEAGRWYVADDPSRACYDSRWWALFPIGFAGILVYALAVPSLVVFVLRRQRAREDGISFVLKYGFLVARFKDAHWYFEAAIMGRKLVLVAVLTAFAAPDSKASAGVVVLAGSLVHLAVVLPYRATLHNSLAVGVLAAAALVLEAGTVEDRKVRHAGVGIGIVTIVVGIVVGNVLDVLRMLRSERKAAEELDDEMMGMMRTSEDTDGDGATLVTMSSMDSVAIGHVESQQFNSIAPPPPLDTIESHATTFRLAETESMVAGGLSSLQMEPSSESERENESSSSRSESESESISAACARTDPGAAAGVLVDGNGSGAALPSCE